LSGKTESLHSDFTYKKGNCKYIKLPFFCLPLLARGFSIRILLFA
jgi:hypothetical protein